MSKKSLIFIADKSSKFLDKHTSAYEALRQNSSIVIGIISIFIPLVILLFRDTNFVIKMLSYCIICLVVWSVLIFLKLIRSKPLSRGITPNEYEDLINSSLKDVLKKEIAYNLDSYKDNVSIFENKRKKFNKGITILIISIVLCVILLFINTLATELNKAQTPCGVSIEIYK